MHTNAAAQGRSVAANPAPLPSASLQGTLARKTKEGTLTILSSSIDTNSVEFRGNAENMRALTAELQQRRAQAALGGSEKSRGRHKARGKLLPRERMMNLIAPGSPFLVLS